MSVHFLHLLTVIMVSFRAAKGIMPVLFHPACVVRKKDRLQGWLELFFSRSSRICVFTYSNIPTRIIVRKVDEQLPFF